MTPVGEMALGRATEDEDQWGKPLCFSWTQVPLKGQRKLLRIQCVHLPPPYLERDLDTWVFQFLNALGFHQSNDTNPQPYSPPSPCLPHFRPVPLAHFLLCEQLNFCSIK